VPGVAIQPRQATIR